MFMRTLSATTVLLAALLTSAPARAFDYERLLTQTFGSSDPKDLGWPIFGLIALFSVVFFWGALRIGRKRQRRMIESYNEQLQDYSGRLRRNIP
jgi:hypothetical protein